MSLECETRQHNSALTALKQRAAPPTLTDQQPNVLYTMPMQTVERLEEVLQRTLTLQENIRVSMAALATKESLEPLAPRNCCNNGWIRRRPSTRKPIGPWKVSSRR